MFKKLFGRKKDEERCKKIAAAFDTFLGYRIGEKSDELMAKLTAAFGEPKIRDFMHKGKDLFALSGSVYAEFQTGAVVPLVVDSYHGYFAGASGINDETRDALLDAGFATGSYDVLVTYGNCLDLFGPPQFDDGYDPEVAFRGEDPISSGHGRFPCKGTIGHFNQRPVPFELSLIYSFDHSIDMDLGSLTTLTFGIRSSEDVERYIRKVAKG